MRSTIVPVVALSFLIGLPCVAATAKRISPDVRDRLKQAGTVFQEIMDTPGKEIPQNLLDDAQCIAIIPGMKKGGFIFGAQYGKGFISCREPSGMGWTPPGAVTIEGGSFGFQLGGEETDVVMLLMNKDAENRLFSDQFTLGGNASIAAGPVGRSASAQTDAMMTAEILSYARSRGVFAGVSLKGSTLRQDRDVNDDVYGKAYTNKQIVEGEIPANPAVRPLIRELDKYSPRKTS